jgi:hypothetical protein
MTVSFALFTLAAACVETREDRILARDLAQAVPQLAAVPGDAVLGLAPRPGIERIIRPAEIRSFAARWSLPVEVSEPVCVTGRLRVIEAAEAQASLRAPVAALLGDAAAVDVLAISNRPVPEGELVFPASGWTAEGKDRLRWRGYVVAASGAKYPVWAVIRAETAAIRRPVRRPTPKDVKAGDDVRVTVTVGAARLSLDALAETSGRAGERVLLKNRESGRRFAAVIVGPGQARIGGDHDRQN